MRTGLNVVTPTRLDYDKDIPFRVVYLLHGLTDAHTCWSDNTQLPLFADKFQAVFFMPEVQRSFYTNMEHGLRYYDYITDELPKICKKLFGISAVRENTYVMGLSMGGYGALKCALDKPDRYAGCGAFSSPCDMAAVMKVSGQMAPQEMEAICGLEKKLRAEDDLTLLIEKCAVSEKPRIYMSCGIDDPLRGMNIPFYEHLKAQGFDVHYEEWPGGHDWYFWNESLHRALAHLMNDRR